MLIKLESKIKELHKNFNKEVENIIKKQQELKNTITEIKYIFYVFLHYIISHIMFTYILYIYICLFRKKKVITINKKLYERKKNICTYIYTLEEINNKLDNTEELSSDLENRIVETT